MGPTKINSDRQRAVDFTVPFLDTGISILVAKQTGVIAKLAFLGKLGQTRVISLIALNSLDF